MILKLPASTIAAGLLTLTSIHQLVNAHPLQSQDQPALVPRRWYQLDKWLGQNGCPKFWFICQSQPLIRTSPPVPTPSIASSDDQDCDDDIPEEDPDCEEDAIPSANTTNDNGLDFITRKGGILYDGSYPFRFVSANAPSLLVNGDKPNNNRVIPDPYEQDDLMRSIAGLGGRVARTYTFSVGYHITGKRAYDEKYMVAVDNAIAAASRHKVRLIIPFINNDITIYNTGEKFFYGSYAAFADLYGKSKDAFFTDPIIREDFKAFITFVLNRKNTVTGIRYRDDPAILAWQTGNELKGWEESPPPASWISEIAAHIKSQAPRTLVFDGTIGGSSRWQAPKDPNVDILGNHYYGINDRANLKREAALAVSYGKVFIAAEFGLTDVGVYNQIMDETVENRNVTGCLIWSLRGHSAGGGFFVHSEGKKDTTQTFEIVSYHVPGFQANTADKFGPEEGTVIPAIRSRALRIQGLSANNTPYPTPPAPVILSATNGRLTWRGSSWAASYRIFKTRRGAEFRGGSQPLRSGVTDRISANLALTQAMWVDDSFAQGSDVTYRIQAVGVGGQLSEISAGKRSIG
ncbi:glycoside hydrolase superfamily [Phlyctochytrium arcticum]|nr:glycoside hydrolase superfamily [Phlyctochytrium arcticum]